MWARYEETSLCENIEVLGHNDLDGRPRFQMAHVPREIAYYIPADPDKWAYNSAAGDLHPGTNNSITEDALVGNRGNIFVDTLHQGVFALRCTV